MSGLPCRSTCPCSSAFRCLSSALSIGSAPTSPSPHCAPWRRARRPRHSRIPQRERLTGQLQPLPLKQNLRSTWQASTVKKQASPHNKDQQSKFLSAVPIDFPKTYAEIRRIAIVGKTSIHHLRQNHLTFSQE